MTIRQNAFSAATAAALVLALAHNASAAVDGDAVFETLAAQVKKQGLELTAEKIEARGDDVALSNLKITVPGGNDGFQMEQVLLENVEDIGNGAYVIGRIAMPSLTQTNEGWTVDFEGAAIEGYYLSGKNAVDPISSIGIYRALNIGAVKLENHGNVVFKLDGVTSTMSPYEPGAKLDMKGEVKDFFIDFSQIPEPEVQRAMAEVGYPQLSGRMTGSGTWDTDNGDMTVHEKLTLDDAAALNIDVAIGGYTPELIAAMQEMQKTMEGQSEEAMGLAMLGLMQQLEIGNISIELVDDSGTNKLLDFAAKKQRTNREGLIAMAKGTLPVVLAQLQNPEFAAKVSAAVSAYLDNPRSLKIVAAPPAPVPVAQIMASAMSAPQSIIGVLAIDVTANE
ncbi:MAG: hypothetical protein Kow0026_05830 [Oricola sp.]